MIEVAITVDDLPEHGDIGGSISRFDMASTMIDTFKKYAIPPVYGFVNGLPLENNPSYHLILKMWVKNGNQLGNHTYSHIDLIHTSVEKYLLDIKKNEECLTTYLSPFSARYFRYPYMREGNTSFKYVTIKKFLLRENYINVPATIDFSDYLWNSEVSSILTKGDGIENLKNEYI